MYEVIVNPAARNGQARQIGEEAERYLKEKQVDFVIRYTEYPGHATELARDAANRGVETVIAMGGDGTVCETAAGLVHTNTSLGIAPAGTGNDFIKTIGTPRNWKEALDFILTHPARPVNTGEVNDRFFLNVCGGGFDVLTLTYALEAKKHVKGIWPALYGVLRAIRTFKPFKMHIQVGDDLTLDKDCMICTIANGRYIGGGIPIASMADVEDGLLDVLVVDAVPRWKIPFYLPSLMGGSLYKRKVAHHYRVKTCSLSSPGMMLNLDGEILPIEESHYRIFTDALKVHW